MRSTTVHIKSCNTEDNNGTGNPPMGQDNPFSWIKIKSSNTAVELQTPKRLPKPSKKHADNMSRMSIHSSEGAQYHLPFPILPPFSALRYYARAYPDISHDHDVSAYPPLLSLSHFRIPSFNWYLGWTCIVRSLIVAPHPTPVSVCALFSSCHQLVKNRILVIWHEREVCLVGKC